MSAHVAEDTKHGEFIGSITFTWSELLDMMSDDALDRNLLEREWEILCETHPDWSHSQLIRHFFGFDLDQHDCP